MTTSLTVIGLVLQLKVSALTAYGNAVYRNKSTNENHPFIIKQFINTRDEYNEVFKEGDLVVFCGKFTLDDQIKIMVSLMLMKI
jgi:hypothetical protein